ncbi:4-alpha-glucanotransferase [Rhodoplanes sp. Z2-YC6860]|uniref:4-alpha-glucanotransferase n=1 Tax=Rhodoplanes sp. Z2-YC6860 TaxID=674703 RepID=UPI00078EB5DE|nr:4-alpha-glucanotransferase [Rhodoplanes sp. Z2-YC6860]AMN43943.1 4-alpha-glucanotransferase [Rhodoplanes sp. Z2-YC6860]
MENLPELAAHWGVETSYFDVQGGRHEASPEVLRRVIAALQKSQSKPAVYPDTGVLAEPAFQGDGRRVWILAVQLYGVRSARNWGHGDFTDLAALLEIVAKVGGAGVGLNPLHALFYDRSAIGSPYSPSSRLFINPLYIDVTRAPGFKPRQIEGFASEIERLRAGELVDYLAVAKLKLAALHIACRDFFTLRDASAKADFEAFRREGGRELAMFAAFETLRSMHAGHWPDWPDEWRVPSDEIVDHLRQSHAGDFAFHEYLQWVADRQLADCRDVAKHHGMPVGLYLDTAIGVDGSGADAWMAQRAVLQDLSVGAPPDQYNPAGQDWGLTAYNPHGLIASKFEPFRRMLRAAMRYAGAIRIDHVLGLMRLFVIPHGLGAADGVYLRGPFFSMLKVVSEESHRFRCAVIGEDLGTVPEGFRTTLASWGLWSYLVMLFERNWDGSFRPPSEYPDMAIATLNTHDLPTFVGWMSGHDLQHKRSIGVDPGESDEERHRSREALKRAIEGEGLEGVVRFLARTPTRLVSVSIEDILDVRDQINMPGTVTQYPNWRRRWPLTLEALASEPRLERIAAVLEEAGRAARRS